MRERVVRGDLMLQHVLYSGIGNRVSGLRCSEGSCAGSLPVANWKMRDAVLTQLVDERAGENEIEKLVYLPSQCLLGSLPGGTPEDRKNLYCAQQRSITVGQMRCSSRPSGQRIRGWRLNRLSYV